MFFVIAFCFISTHIAGNLMLNSKKLILNFERWWWTNTTIANNLSFFGHFHIFIFFHIHYSPYIT